MCRLVICAALSPPLGGMKRFKAPQTAFSERAGWPLRGARRRRGYERGFTLQRSRDWNGLLRSVAHCGARQV